MIGRFRVESHDVPDGRAIHRVMEYARFGCITPPILVASFTTLDGAQEYARQQNERNQRPLPFGAQT